MASCLAYLSLLFMLNLVSVGDAKPFFGGLRRGWPFAEPLVRDDEYVNEIWTHNSAGEATGISPEVATASDLSEKQRADIFEEPTERDGSETRLEGQSEVIPGTAQGVADADNSDINIPTSVSADVKPLAEPPLDFAEELEAVELDLIMKRMHDMCDGLAAKPAHLRRGLVADLCRSICVD